MPFEIDKVYETQISSLIESQFPEAIRDIMGPVFVNFVKLYYVWMETEGQALFHARRLMSYKDIDTTTDEFLVYFKEKYLKNIQLETNSNVKFLIKNSLDIYRARGTPRAIDLLFRLVFGVGADIYYPSTDIFRLSDGRWYQPKYLEISLANDTEKFVGKEIIGLKSNARAFVERLVRRKTRAQINDILYISSIIGTFETGELINAVVEPFSVEEIPTVVGSLTTLEVVDGSLDFEVGDIVNVSSLHGSGAKARVASVTNQTGTVTFDIADGGFGYTVGTPVLVSNTVLTLSNVTANASLNNTHSYFNLFETIYQPMATIVYINGTGNFAANDAITAYHANGSVKGTGVAISHTSTNSSAGFMQVSIRSGNLSANIIGNFSNVVTANQSVSGGYLDATASGNIISQSSNTTLYISNVVGDFIQGEEIYQINGSNTANGIISNTDISLGNGTIKVVNTIFNMFPGVTVRGRTSGATANLNSIDMQIGVIDANGTFSTDPLATFSNLVSGTTGFVSRASIGSGARANVGQIDLSEDVTLNTDILYPFLSGNLDATYAFAALPGATLSSNISDCLTTNTFTIGRIAGLTGINGGTGYSNKPFTRVMQPYVYPYLRRDYRMTGNTVSGNFQQDEEVTQTATGAKGVIISANAGRFFVQRTSLFKDFVATTNSTTTMVGVASGAVANLTYVDNDYIARTLDINQEYIAVDAEISTNTQTANGAVLTFEVTDSGFGFQENEMVDFFSDDGERQGTAHAHLNRHGVGSGFYTRLGGRLSAEKKLFDGFYYQDFSYEVRSSITLNKYKDMLLNILHVAGTLPFGALYYNGVVDAGLTAVSEDITEFHGASGVATVTGIGAAKVAAAGVSTGSGTIVSRSLALNYGNATASATVSGVGTALYSSNGVANGAVTANGIGASSAKSLGTANGHATVTGRK